MHYGKPKKISDNDQYYAGQNPITNKEWLPDDIRYGIKKVSKEVCLNGPAAGKVQKGDVIIVISYALMCFEKAKSFTPKLIFPNQDNSI